MLSAVDPVPRLLDGQRRLQKQQQEKTVNIEPPRLQSTFLSEAAVACEEISPCCCACAYHRTTGSEYERDTEHQAREMYFCACGKSRQHPLKAAPYRTTNADAFLIDSQILGVADGVGSVETEGYDPALLPVELLTQCSLLFRLRQQNAAVFDTESETLWANSGGPTDGFNIEAFPLHIIGRAHASCVSLGSTTCVLGMLDCRRRRLYTVNVGDSRLLVLRRVSSTPAPRKRTITVKGARETGLASQPNGNGGRAGAAVPVFPLLPPSLKTAAEQDAAWVKKTTVARRGLEAPAAPATEAKERMTTADSEQEPTGRTAQPTGKETDSRGAQEQQQQPVRHGEKADAAKQRGMVTSNNDAMQGRRLQATEEATCGRSWRDGERTREMREDSDSGSEEGRQLQQGEGKEEERYQVVYRTEVQQHFFNCPYQLTRMPDVDCSQEAVLRRTQASADLGFCDMKGGDIIILGSDGLFDNLFEDEIVAVVNTFCCGDSSSSSGSETERTPPADPALIADQLLNMALAAAAGDRVEVPNCENGRRLPSSCGSSSPSTPFSQAAYEELGRCVEGGKPDDTTVVVAFVVETKKQDLTPCQEQRTAQPPPQRYACVESSIVSEARERCESGHTGRTSLCSSKVALVSDSRRRIDLVASDGAVPCAENSQPVPAAAAATGGKNTATRTSATVAFTPDAAATVPVAPEEIVREGMPDATDFARRRATTFSNEELSVSVSEEMPQTSTAAPGGAVMISSIAVHGRYRSSSLSTAKECSDYDSEDTTFYSEQGDGLRTGATRSRCSPNRSSATVYPAEQHVKCSKDVGYCEAHVISAHSADVARRDLPTEVRLRGEDTKQSSLSPKVTKESGRPDVQVAGAPRACMPTTAADTKLKRQGGRHEQLPLRADTERSFAASHGLSTTIASADTGRQAPMAQMLPATRGWCLFRQPQPDSHLTLVMRAAPTPRSQVTRMPGIRDKTEFTKMHRYTRHFGSTPLDQKHGNTAGDACGLDLRPLIDQGRAATRATTPSKPHRQMQTQDSADKTHNLSEPSQTVYPSYGAATRRDPKPIEKIRCRAARVSTENAAVAPTRASSFASDEGLDHVLSSNSPLKIPQDAATSSRWPQQSSGGERTAAPHAQSSAGGSRRGSTYTHKVSGASRARGAARTTPAAIAGVPSLAVGGAPPKVAVGAFSRNYPVSVSAILACSRRSFPPINAASLTSLRVHPQATCLQQIYAADKLQALTPAAAAAAVGAGTSPACVAAVHMKILDRRGG